MPVCPIGDPSAVALAPLARAVVVTDRARGERRGADRWAFEYRLRLAPLSGPDDDDTPAGEHYVTARDLSPRGVGFHHESPLPYRRVRLTAADERLEELGLAGLEIEVVLRWCRFVGPGRYESGGKIARSSGGLIVPAASVA